MADTVSVTIDDQKITVPAGTLVIDACRSIGIDIPVFCSHPRLEPLGACRMCLVEFVGPRGSRLDTSCTVRVSEGMVVRTDSAEVLEARKAVLAFLLINHPLDCPICDKGGECPLQDQTMEHGPGASAFVEPKRHKNKAYPVSDLIMLDQERCVLCWRCIRYLEEWEDKPQLGLFRRGASTVIDIFPNQPVDAKTSGSIIDICPVGALTDRSARFHYRPWELKRTPSICTHCPVGCNLRLDERVHELRRVVARENMALNDNWICDKGRFLHQFADHKERLTAPLVRDQGGSLREATWQEALDRVIARMDEIVETHGPRAVGGVAKARVSNETAYLLQKFFRVLMRSNNVDFSEGSAVRATPAGMGSIQDVYASDLIVLVGLDAAEVAPVLDLHIKRAVRRNKTKLLVIHPRRIEAVKYAGAYLPAWPGSEAAALNGIGAGALILRDAARRGRMGDDEWTWLRNAPGAKPEAVLAASGISLADQSAAAELLLKAQRPLFLYGAEAATGESGAAAVSALLNLAALSGQPDRVAYIAIDANNQGCRDLGLLPDTLPGGQPLAEPAVRERLGKLWGVQPPAEPGLGYRQMVEGGVRGLYIVADNPAADPTLREKLDNVDFLVVQDLFLTETAQLADVVLPAVSWAETDGTYTNLERRVQRAPQSIRERAQPDWQILTALAERWFKAQAPLAEAAPAAEPEWKKKRRQRAAREARENRPQAKAWNYGSAAMVLEEIAKAAPAYAGIRWETLGSAGVQWPANLAPRTARRIEPVRPAPPPQREEGSLWLVASPRLWDASVLMQHGAEVVRRLIPEPTVWLSASEMSRLGLADGDRVSVASARSTVTLVACGEPAVQPGTAWIPVGLAGAPAEALGAGLGEAVAVKLSKVA